MRTVWLFTTAQVEIGYRGFYSFEARERPDKPLICSATGFVKKPFINDSNMAEFSAIGTGLYRTKQALTQYISAPYRVVVVSRNQNAIYWLNTPAKYVGRHKEKNVEIANLFAFALGSYIDPGMRIYGFPAGKHPGLQSGIIPDTCKEIEMELWGIWSPEETEKILRRIRKKARAELDRHNAF